MRCTLATINTFNLPNLKVSWPLATASYGITRVAIIPNIQTLFYTANYIDLLAVVKLGIAHNMKCIMSCVFVISW